MRTKKKALKRKRGRTFISSAQPPSEEPAAHVSSEPSQAQLQTNDSVPTSHTHPSHANDESEPQDSQHQAIHEEPQPSQQRSSSKRKKGRGPTNCLDVDNLQNSRVTLRRKHGRMIIISSQPPTSEEPAPNVLSEPSDSQHQAIHEEPQPSQQPSSSKHNKGRGPPNCLDVYNLQNSRVALRKRGRMIRNIAQPPPSKEPVPYVSSEPSQAQPSHANNESERQHSQHQAIHDEPRPSQQPSSSKRKKGRGPTNCLDIYNLQNSRVVITLNKFNQPIGESANTISQFLGTLARNGDDFPIDVKHWNCIPDSKKEAAWAFIKTKFDISDEGKEWTMLNLNEKWRNWKHKLAKKFYNPQLPIANQLDCPEDRVKKEQWINLLHHLESEEWKKRSEINKINRSKKIIGHSTGTKSFARIRSEEEKSRGKIDRASFFVKTHTRKDGSAVDKASEEVMEKMKEILAQQSIDNYQTSSCANDDVYAQVMDEERPTRVRLLGLGPTPSKIWGSLPRHKMNVKLVEENKRLNEKVNKLEDTVSHLQAQFEKFIGARQVEDDVGSPIISPRSVPSSNGSYPDDSSLMAANEAVAALVDKFNNTPHCDTMQNSPGISVPKDPKLVKLTYPGSTTIVARGFLMSDDPTKCVGDMQLGSGWVEILIKAVESPKTPLLRFQKKVKTLHDAMVKEVSIAWIKQNVQDI